MATVTGYPGSFLKNGLRKKGNRTNQNGIRNVPAPLWEAPSVYIQRGEGQRCDVGTV